MEANKRVQRYKDYAKEMKNKFEQYEVESEKYYSDLLDKFKEQAKQICEKKERELADAKHQLDRHESKIERIRERMVAKSYKGIMSDVEESSEDEEEPIKLDMVEYNFLRAERNRHKLVIEQWVRNFKESKKRNPKDSDTTAIIQEITNYNDAEKEYLDFKLKMIQAKLLVFDPQEYAVALVQKGTQDTLDKF